MIMPSVKEPAVVAVKMLKEGHTDGDVIDLVKEMEIMKRIGKHVNIINLLGVCTQPSGQPLLVIVEFAEHGNLRDFLRARRPELVRYLTRQGDRHVSLRDMLSFALQVDCCSYVRYHWSFNIEIHRLSKKCKKAGSELCQAGLGKFMFVLVVRIYVMLPP